MKTIRLSLKINFFYYKILKYKIKLISLYIEYIINYNKLL